MAIPKSQLEIWSHQGAVTTSKNIYASIKGNLGTSDAPYAGKSFKIFLQGSYGNDTNIRADSDVDVVMMLTSIFRPDISQLPQEQSSAFHRTYPNAKYRFSDFKDGVVSQLKSAHGYSNVKVGNKSIKISAALNRLGADVVVCFQYRYYHFFFDTSNQSCVEGIVFPTTSGTTIINYPKLHSSNCTAKHQSTGSMFKPIVRIFKNVRRFLCDQGAITDDIAPSYFIEGLLYNVPANQYVGDLETAFCNCVNWLHGADQSRFTCPNERHILLGNSSVQWDTSKCANFLDAVIELWNGW